MDIEAFLLIMIMVLLGGVIGIFALPNILDSLIEAKEKWNELRGNGKEQ